MKATHKPKKSDVLKGRIDISVGKYRWISYNGTRINYDLIFNHFSRDRNDLILFLKENCPSFHSPPGLYGGNIPTIAQMEEPMRLLKMMGLYPQLLKKEIKFYVTICGSAAPDTNPDPRSHAIDYKRCNGYPSRNEANKAAQSRFAYYNAWCRDDNGGKRTNIVTLKLFDKDGNLTEEKSN